MKLSILTEGETSTTAPAKVAFRKETDRRKRGLEGGVGKSQGTFLLTNFLKPPQYRALSFFHRGKPCDFVLCAVEFTYVPVKERETTTSDVCECHSVVPNCDKF